MPFVLIEAGESRSFPDPGALRAAANADAEVLLIAGGQAGAHFHADPDRAAILIELGTECLGVHTGEDAGTEGANVLGFARVRIGDGEPSKLVELVRQPNTSEGAIEAAKAVFAELGLEVALCHDLSGRIVDRLVRPYYNDALKGLDQRIASAADMDLTVRLGLGYPKGPIELLESTGLAHHHDVTKALFDIYGTPAYAPARRAVVAKMREGK
ncbi:MAG: 3-hydroxyacyl-CoA dehydrogenase family protein [Alphaproteobacteria bacterium]